MSTSGTSGTSGGSTHIFRSLSSESQKREWSKRLSLRGMRHGGGTAGLATSKEVSGEREGVTPRYFRIKLRFALTSYQGDASLPASASTTGGGGGKHRKFFSRSASLKQAATSSSMSSTQTSMELHVPGHSSSGGAGSPAGGFPSQTQPSTPKKSNWEVIEHFNTSNVKGGKAMVSSSLIAVSCCQLIGDQTRAHVEQGVGVQGVEGKLARFTGIGIN